eukprot:6155462-Pleurochrysis_carterae.AAC.1
MHTSRQRERAQDAAEMRAHSAQKNRTGLYAGGNPSCDCDEHVCTCWSPRLRGPPSGKGSLYCSPHRAPARARSNAWRRGRACVLLVPTHVCGLRGLTPFNGKRARLHLGALFARSRGHAMGRRRAFLCGWV